MAVHLLPAVLQALLAFACDLLSLPQQRLLIQLMLAWLLGSGGKLVDAARIATGKHRTSQARFLNKSSWDAFSHWRSGRRSTGWLPRSLLPSITSLLASTVPNAGHQFTAPVLDRTAADVLKSMRPRRGEVLHLIIDDTRTAKRGRTMPAVQKTWDHAAQRFVRGHIIVTAAVLFRGVTLPWRSCSGCPRITASPSG